MALYVVQPVLLSLNRTERPLDTQRLSPKTQEAGLHDFSG